MARKMKFAEGGSSKYDERYKRKLADIEKDYAKASKGKTGKAADVAKAKYEQRMADAKDDLAKWTKSDRTQTRAAEKSAERNLSMTRKYGATKSATEKDVGETARVSTPSDVIKAPAIDSKFVPKAQAKAPSKPAAKPAAKADAPASNKPSVDKRASFRKDTALKQAELRREANRAAMRRNTAGIKRVGYGAGLSPADAAREQRIQEAQRKANEDRKEPVKYIGYSNYNKRYAKGGSVKKPMPKEGATGDSSTVPMTPERKAFMKRMQDEEAASKKGVKPNPSKYAKGGKMADKMGRAMKKKSADTMGRAMMKKAGGGKCYAKGGSVSSRADGCATKGKTKGKMV